MFTQNPRFRGRGRPPANRRPLRNYRHKYPVATRAGRTLQAGDGVGHRDMVPQAKKWSFFSSVDFVNSTITFSYGLSNINISTTSGGIASAVYSRLMDTAAKTYEEYRIRPVTVRAQPGTGYTNDDRIKSSIFARVDVNSQPTVASIDNLNSLICSESAVNRTFTERSNVKLVDFRPICFSTGGIGASSRPILPSQVQWYNIDERGSHLWRGATVSPVIPEILAPNSKAITVWAEVEIEFRSRRPDFANFTSVNPFEPSDPIELSKIEATEEQSGDDESDLMDTDWLLRNPFIQK